TAGRRANGYNVVPAIAISDAAWGGLIPGPGHSSSLSPIVNRILCAVAALRDPAWRLSLADSFHVVGNTSGMFTRQLQLPRAEVHKFLDLRRGVRLRHAFAGKPGDGRYQVGGLAFDDKSIQNLQSLGGNILRITGEHDDGQPAINPADLRCDLAAVQFRH